MIDNENFQLLCTVFICIPCIIEDTDANCVAIFNFTAAGRHRTGYDGTSTGGDVTFFQNGYKRITGNLFR
jgi:hypothetical protein